MPIWNQSREPVSKTQEELERYLKKEHHPGEAKTEPADKGIASVSDVSTEAGMSSEEMTYYYLSIASLVFTVIAWPFGLIIGGICLSKMRRGSKGRTFALVSVVLGSVYLVFIIFMILIVLFLA